MLGWGTNMDCTCWQWQTPPLCPILYKMASKSNLKNLDFMVLCFVAPWERCVSLTNKRYRVGGFTLKLFLTSETIHRLNVPLRHLPVEDTLASSQLLYYYNSFKIIRHTCTHLINYNQSRKQVNMHLKKEKKNDSNFTSGAFLCIICVFPG